MITEVLMVHLYFKTAKWKKKTFQNKKWKLGQYLDNPTVNVIANTEIAQIMCQAQF
jgi:hypothetical protein